MKLIGRTFASLALMAALGGCTVRLVVRDSVGPVQAVSPPCYSCDASCFGTFDIAAFAWTRDVMQSAAGH
jgi:hypothetical protein